MLNGIIKGKWELIEVVIIESQEDVNNRMVIHILAKDEKYKLEIKEQLYEPDLGETDKLYCLTRYLMVVEYVKAINEKLLFCSFKDFSAAVERFNRDVILEGLETLEDEENGNVVDGKPNDNSKRRKHDATRVQ